MADDPTGRVEALEREVKRLAMLERMAARHAIERDKDVAELEAQLANRKAEIARLNAGEARRQLELHDAHQAAEPIRRLVDAARVWRAQFAKPAASKLPRQAALIAAVDALDEATQIAEGDTQ